MEEYYKEQLEKEQKENAHLKGVLFDALHESALLRNENRDLQKELERLRSMKDIGEREVILKRLANEILQVVDHNVSK
jgi:hypothetical protein